MSKSNTITTQCILVISLLIGGCANVPTPNADSGKLEIVTIPPVNIESSAEIGQTIISKEYLRRRPGIFLEETVSDRANPPGLTTIKSTRLPLFATEVNGKYYRDASATYTLMGVEVPIGERAGVFVPSDKTKPPVVFHYAMGYRYGSIPINNIKEGLIEEWSRDSFKRELVYSGVSQNTISILYREFKDDLARPAFSQELKYDLSQGKEIGYKGARFEVIKATNTGLTYKVLKSLD